VPSAQRGQRRWLQLRPSAPQSRHRWIVRVPAQAAQMGAPSTHAGGRREKPQRWQCGRPRAAARWQPTQTGPRSVSAAIRRRRAQYEHSVVGVVGVVGVGAQRRQIGCGLARVVAAASFAAEYAPRGLEPGALLA
jgi:hypothetical protein